MELKVNKDKCIGCGMCVSTLEEVFDFDFTTPFFSLLRK